MNIYKAFEKMKELESTDGIRRQVETTVSMPTDLKEQIKEQIKEMNKCVDDIAEYIKNTKKIVLSRNDKNIISVFIANAMIVAAKAH